MKDPLQNQGEEQALFDAITELCVGHPNEQICRVVINVLANAIRQSTANRKHAEEKIDEWFGCAKTILLDVHYDPVSGLRRSVFPLTQVAKAPLHVEDDVIFHK